MNEFETRINNLRNAMIAIVELRRSNPSMTLNDIYAHLDVKRMTLNLWCKRVFGVTVAIYVKSVLKGKSIKPLKYFKVKQYVELTPAGLAAILGAMNGYIAHALPRDAITDIAYGAISDTDMLCVELTARADSGYRNSTVVYTNYVLRDPELFRPVVHTTPGVLLAIQNRNLGLEY